MRSETGRFEWGVQVIFFCKNGKEKNRRQFLFSLFASEAECVAAAENWTREIEIEKCVQDIARREARDRRSRGRVAR